MSLQLLTHSTLSLLPELIILIAATVLMIWGSSSRKDKNNGWKLLFSLSALFVSFLLNYERFINFQIAFSGSLSLNAFSAFFNSILIVCCAITLIISRDYMGKTSRVTEFFVLTLLSTVGMMVLVESRDFMSLFLGFELMSLCVYILSGFNRKSILSTEAGIKYLILGGFSSAVLLYGMALLYGASGSIMFEDVLRNFDVSNPLFIAGTALVLGGFIFKIGAFPLYQWVPDVYQGAPIPATSFMSVGVKSAAFGILIIFLLLSIHPKVLSLSKLIVVISILTMTIGNIAAINQNNIKRMLAYSSIAHAGYILVGVVAFINGQSSALDNTLYYLYAYTFMNLGAFSLLSYLSKEDEETDELNQLSGLWGNKPLAAVALGIFMFSLAGIPPTIGFFAKYRIFHSAVNAGFVFLVLIAVVNSVISAYYYIRVLAFAFMKEDTHKFLAGKPLTFTVVLILAIGNLIFGVFPLYSLDIVKVASQSLFIP